MEKFAIHFIQEFVEHKKTAFPLIFRVEASFCLRNRETLRVKLSFRREEVTELRSQLSKGINPLRDLSISHSPLPTLLRVIQSRAGNKAKRKESNM